MSLIGNLNEIKSIKETIKTTLENKGVDMTGVPFSGYADKISNMYVQKDICEEAYDVKNIYNSASFVAFKGFDEDPQIETINLPNCELVKNYAFRSCHQLTTASLPECKIVGNAAFDYCEQLSHISLPKCEYLGFQAFRRCSALTTISLPNVMYADSTIFQFCEGLSEVYMPKLISLSSNMFSACSALKVLNLDNVFNVPNNYFKNISLNSISLSNCRMIGRSAFYNKFNYLTTIDLPRCVQIASVAFYPNKFSFINLPVLLKYNGQAFTNCEFRGPANIGTSVYGVVDYNIFSGVIFSTNSETAPIYVNKEYYSYYSTAEGWSSLYNLGLIKPSENSEENMLYYSDGVLGGNTYAIFYDFSSIISSSIIGDISLSLSAVSLPNCECVWSDAFYLYSSLKSVYMPNCSYLGDDAFYRCRSLQSVYMPNCSYVGNDAFFDGNSLSEIDLPNCWYVGKNAFFRCIMTVIDMPKCRMIDGVAFGLCGALQSINLPLCSYIGNNAFSGCNNLSSVSLPNVITVSNYAFSGCNALRDIDLPSCKTLYGDAFYGCSLNTLTIGRSYSYVCSLSGSLGCIPNSIYVPASLYHQYINSGNWVQYSDIMHPIQ